MASKAIRPKRDDGPLTSDWQTIRESAPSMMRDDQPGMPRWIALLGLMMVALGGAAVSFAVYKKPYLVDSGWGGLLLALGFGALLFHAFQEKELQYRRLYAMAGMLFFVVGVGLRLLSYQGHMGGLWMPIGCPALFVALAFLAAFARHETDLQVRMVTTNLLGITGLALALLGGGIGFFNEGFLVTQGIVSLVLGLLYLVAFIGLQDANSQRGYYAGWVIVVLGGAMFLASAWRSFGLELLYALRLRESAPTDAFLVPSGLVLMYFGLEYLVLGIGIVSDRPLVVLTRRELAAFFYSPVAYVVIAGTTAVGWFMYLQFARSVILVSEEAPTSPWLFEPIVRHYVFSLFPVICIIFMIPVLTMRLLSEESRSGTLEVLLTAPVNETPVVLSKFLAAFRIFVLAWIPWGIYLVAFRLETGQDFDYRPLLGFFIVLAANGAGFLAMGLFFSALTRDQMASAIFTFVGMLFFTLLFFLKSFLPSQSPWIGILTYVSYIDLWDATMQGTLAPRFLLFYLSVAVFFLFLTTKVLEARKWS